MTVDEAGSARAGSEPKAKVFISYAREDMAFVDRLDAALATRGFEPLVDRTDIYAFEDWWKRIEALIARADAVVFVLSPDAVASEVALKEIDFAASLNKRFAPIVCREVDGHTVPEALRRLNWIDFGNAAQFDERMDRLAEALATDIDWVRKHTEFGEAARRWAEAGRPGPRGLLLRSPVLEEAERWIAARPPGAPPPTEETQALVTESRRAATRRRNVLTGGLAAGLVVALGLAGLAYWQRGVAVEQERIAQAQRSLAIQERDRALLTQSRFLADVAQQNTRADDAGTAVLLALEALPDARASVSRPYAHEAETALAGALQDLRETAMFEAHAREVSQAVFSPDGRRIATGSVDGTVRIWDVESRQIVGVLEGHAGWISDVSFSPDGRRIVTASEDKTARIWETATFRTILILSGHTDVIYRAKFSPDGRRVVTASGDKTARVWDTEDGRVLTQIAGFSALASDASFSPDGQRLVIATRENVAHIWDAETGQALVELKAASGISNAQFSPDGRRVLTLSSIADGMRLWDAQTGREVLFLRAEGAWRAAFSRDGKLVAANSGDKAVRIWDLASEKPIAVLRHPDYVYSSVFSPDGQEVITTSRDRVVRLWRWDASAKIMMLRRADAVKSAAFAPIINES